MNFLLRWLQRLEEKVASHEIGRPSWVEILQERRRRRAGATGLPCVEPVREPLGLPNGRCPTWAETLRHRRAQRCAEAEAPRAAQGEHAA